MATVGDMVREWRVARNRPAIQSALLTALQSLGIWDTEVLELPVCRLHCADCAFHLQFPSVLLPEPGQTVRVIVLKEE